MRFAGPQPWANWKREPLSWAGHALMVVVLLSMLALSGLFYMTRQFYLHSAEVEGANLAWVIESRLDAALRRIDANLIELQTAVKTEDLGAKVAPERQRALTQMLRVHQNVSGETRSIEYFDRDGQLRYSSRSTAGFSIADRAYFQALRLQPASGLVFSEVLNARTDGRPALVAARALTDRDGRFIGTVSTLIDLAYFSRLLEQVDVGPSGVIAIRRSDSSALVLRRPLVTELFNQPANYAIRDRVRAGEVTGVQTLASPSDGVERISTFRALHGYPFYVVVARSTDDVLKAWRSQSLTVAGVAAVLLLALAWFSRRLALSEASHKATSERWQLAINSASDGIWDWNLVTQEVFFSLQWKRMLGYGDAELTNSFQTFERLLHPEDRPAVLKAIDTYLRAIGTEFAIEFRLLHKDGSWRWILGRGAALRDADGKPYRMSGSHTDITARKLDEQTLAESETRFREIFNSVSDAIFIHDATDGHLIEVNRRMCEMYGLSRDEALAADPASLSANTEPFTQERALAHIERAATLGPQSFEWLARAANGRLFWTEVNLRFARIGSQTRILAVVRDIQARKQAQDSLQLAASVFTHAREGIMITALDGTIIEVNAAFTTITGFDREEVLGRNPRLLNSGRQTPAFYEQMWRELRDNGHWSGEIWNRRKNGDVYSELLTITAVVEADGTPRRYVALFSDISRMKQHEQQLQHMAYHDALTNLPNRLLLADRLKQAMVQAQRRHQHLAVAYLDLDGFKCVNDKLGHQVGDRVLLKVAHHLGSALREGDTLARIGGDEFVAVFSDLHDLSDAEPLVSRLLAAAAQPVLLEGQEVRVSASLGLTLYPQPGTEVDPDLLLRQSDQAMYQAKLAGKNRFHMFDTEHDRHLRGHLESVEHIRCALEQQQFVLHYQPKVNMRSGELIGVEALIRWQHPEHGLLPPSAFLPEVENIGLAVEIGEWVIDSALAQIQRWQEAGLPVRVSVNIGALQLQRPDFFDRLREILARYPAVAASQLELEVLETSALDDVEGVSGIIERCRDIGVLFALDDFGTGYSSLTYLKRLPVAQLKIDQSFVRNVLNDPEDLAILQGVIGLAKAFGRQVIAEGVETVAHGELLLRLGCVLAQGYGVARPMPPERLPEWARSWRPAASWTDGARGLSEDG